MATEFETMSEEFAAFNRQVGARIKRRRGELRMTQKVFAKLLGVSYQQVQKYEAGETGLLACKLYYVARVLGTSVPALMGMTDSAEAGTAPRSELVRLTEAWSRLPPGSARSQLLRYIETLCLDLRENATAPSDPWTASTS